MKRWIAILLAACLMAGGCALAQDDAATAEPTEAVSKLPAPEEVQVLEGTEEPDEPGETADAPTAEPEETADAPTAEPEESADVEPAGTPADDIPEAEPSPTPEPEDSHVWFEEGFGLTLPGGWVRYDVPDADRENGIRYALGDGSGENHLYIRFTPTRMADIDALSEAVEGTEGLSRTGKLSFGGTDFVTFIDSRQNASCCATLWGGDMVVFIFTPQTDSDFMLTASQLMESFDVL